MPYKDKTKNNKYNQEYKKVKYDRIVLLVDKETGSLFRELARQQCKSVSSFIVETLKKALQIK